MAISCDPTALAAAAKCYTCLSDEEKAAVRVYLLAVIAGKTDMSTAELVAAAKSYASIPKPMQAAVEAYLLCAAAS